MAGFRGSGNIGMAQVAASALLQNRLLGPAALRFRLARRLQKQGNPVRLFSTAWPRCTKALCRKTHRTTGNTWSPTSHCDLSTSLGTFPAPKARPSIGIFRSNTECSTYLPVYSVPNESQSALLRTLRKTVARRVHLVHHCIRLTRVIAAILKTNSRRPLQSKRTEVSHKKWDATIEPTLIIKWLTVTLPLLIQSILMENLLDIKQTFS